MEKPRVTIRKMRKDDDTSKTPLKHFHLEFAYLKSHHQSYILVAVKII